MAKRRPSKSAAFGRLKRALLPAAMLMLLGVAPARSEDPVAPPADLPAAMRNAAVRKVPIVAYFSTRQCPWCRKMQVTTLVDRGVQSLLRRFVFVKIDMTDNTIWGAGYGVSGVPATLVLSPDGRVLARRNGYIAPAEMTAFLRPWVGADQAAAGAGDETQALIDGLSEGAPATGGQGWPGLTAAVEGIARADRVGRPRLLEAIAAVGPSTWPALCNLMADKRLGVRAAAADALAGATGESLPFDPFANAADRAAHVAAWRQWVRDNPQAPATRPAGRPAATTRPAPQGTP